MCARAHQIESFEVGVGDPVVDLQGERPGLIEVGEEQPAEGDVVLWRERPSADDAAAIEGEELNAEEVRSSIARRLGMDIAGETEIARPGKLAAQHVARVGPRW